MPKLRDSVYTTQDNTVESQIMDGLPIHEANDLLLLFVASDTGASSFNLCRQASDFKDYSCKFYNANTSAYTDETASINDATANDVMFPPQQATTVGDCIYFGHSVPFSALRINTGTARVGTGITIVWEYYDSSTGWTTLTTTDGTNGFTTTGRQNVTWTSPGTWTTYSVDSTTKYWVRARCSAVTTVTTAPLGTQGWLMDTAWTSESIANPNGEITCATYYLVAPNADWDKYILNRAANETYVVIVLSIEDVNTSTPINTKNSASSAIQTNNMPTVTTTVDDCLLAYFVGCDAARVPTIADGPMRALYGIDGTAISAAAAVGYIENYGTSSSSVRKILSQADGNCLVVLAIAPPGGGATKRDCHMSTNGFKVLDWLNGLTPIGSNLHNQTLTDLLTDCNGTVCTHLAWTAGADTGVNAFHGSARLTSAVYSPRQYQGARLVLASVEDLTDKVLMIHTSPSTIKESQDTSFYYQQGVVVVMADSSDNWKAWKVFGQGVNLPEAAQVPCILDPTNTDVLDSDGSLDKTDIEEVAIMVTPKSITGTNTAIQDFKQVMSVGKTIFCGGTTSYPFTLDDIYNIVMSNENRGMIKGGDGIYQAMFPIQIGDLATNTCKCTIENMSLVFPRLANENYKTIAYNGIAGWAGIIYSGSTGDVINHRNSIISSPSPYQWGFASGSSGATYDFSGLQVIGAKPITLISGITLDGLAFSGCGEIATEGATIQNCSIDSGIDTVALSATSVANLEKVTDCEFNNNTRAIKLSVAGTYIFDNLKFSGNTYDIENASAGLITIQCTNGSNPTTYINTGGGTTSIVTSVYLTVTVKDVGGANVENARVAIYKASDMTELMNELTNSSGIAQETYNYPGSSVSIIVRVRKSSTGIRYFPLNTVGAIDENGYTNTVVLIEDEIAS